MKKRFCLVSIMIIMAFLTGAFLTGCGNESSDFYGTYIFESIDYQSPVLSTTIDYVEERMRGTKYTINEKVFKIESPEITEEFKSPKYIKEELPENPDALSDVCSFIGDGVKWQININTKEGEKTRYRLYLSKDSLWVAFYNNTPNDSEIIMYIYKLSKI